MILILWFLSGRQARNPQTQLRVITSKYSIVDIRIENGLKNIAEVRKLIERTRPAKPLRQRQSFGCYREVAPKGKCGCSPRTGLSSTSLKANPQDKAEARERRLPADPLGNWAGNERLQLELMYMTRYPKIGCTNKFVLYAEHEDLSYLLCV